MRHGETLLMSWTKDHPCTFSNVYIVNFLIELQRPKTEKHKPPVKVFV